MDTTTDTATMYLLQTLKSNPESIKALIAKQALEYSSIRQYFTDLNTQGCESGFVSELVYYWQASIFFDKHYDEIDLLHKQDTQKIACEYLSLDIDLKQALAWFGYEQSAHQMATVMGFR